MGITGQGFHISGNFNKLTKRKPRNWIDKGYRIIVPYKFKWRDKIGNTECDCKEIEEHFEAYYGASWYHNDECALIKKINARPQICNLQQYYGVDMRLIATTEN